MDLSNEEYRFKNKSKHWVPTKINRAIDLFIERTKKYINEQIHEDSKDCYLVKLDVKSLYTSILNSEGIKAVKMAHENFTRKTTATKLITTFFALILTLRNFIFNS